MSITNETLDRWFTYHPPTPEQRAKYDRITEAVRRAAALVLAEDPEAENVVDDLSDVIDEVCPSNDDEGDERSWAFGAINRARENVESPRVALAYLRVARMWANAAIACAPSSAVEPVPPSVPTQAAPTRRCCHPVCDAAATLAVHRSDDHTSDQAHSTDSCAAHLGESLLGVPPGEHWLVYPIEPEIEAST